MDFWGFEGRHSEEIPGEQFLFLDPPTAGPVGGPAANPPPPVADPATEPAVRFSSGGAVEEGPRLTAADRALHTEYDGLSTEYRRYLTSGDAGTIPRWEDFKGNPGALTTWFSANREAMGRNGAPIGDLETRTGSVVRRGEALKTLRTHIADPAHAPGADDAARRTGIRDEAERVTSDIMGAYSPTGGGSGGNGGVGTASGGPGGVAGFREGIRGATGVLADTAALGAAARTNQAIWGGGNGGSYGINVADGMGNTSAFGGPGGGYGNVGTSSFGGVGGFGGGGMGDMSNLGFTIGQQGGEARNKSRMMEGMINQLLAAIMAGNLDAITSALTMCNLKAKTTMTQAATHVVRAMQLYDRQMRTISDQMGAIAGQSGTNNPNTGAQMGHLNSEMNQISMSRQAISNMLRDIMTMNEEISNQEKSFYDVKSREASLYRWS